MTKETHYQLLQRLLSAQEGRAHAMGICGVGLSGVATLLAARGWQVDGCDQQAPAAISAKLRQHGINVQAGHAPEHLDASCDLLIRSAAIPPTHPEVARAGELGIPIALRGEVLAQLLEGRRSVVVCGTHGKTTTASFTVHLLRLLGLDPDWCIGGETPTMGHVAHQGDNPDAPIVVEGDESDGTLAWYHPAVTIVTNVGHDHLDHFGSATALEECFARVIAQTCEALIYCADDSGATRLAAGHSAAISYGIGPGARLRLQINALHPTASDVTATFDGQLLGSATLPLCGTHNVRNAAAALAAAIALGVAPERAFAALEGLNELPARRFEALYSCDGITIISDYAHHPDEIAALMEQAQLQVAARLLVLFQPHRYSRTLALRRDFATVFAGVDELLLLPVYAASEAPLEGGDTIDLYQEMRHSYRRDLPLPRLAGSIANGVAWLERELRAGDLLLVIGAGDVVTAAEMLATRLPQRQPAATEEFGAHLLAAGARHLERNAALGKLTTLHVGGRVDWLLHVDHDAALARILALAHQAGLPLRIMGGGSNTLVSDLGFRGIVISLVGEEYTAIRPTAPDRVMIGAAVSGARLLDYLTHQGLDGIAFMERVPGTFGGWVAGNAGAYRDFIGNHIVRIEALRPDGTAVILDSAEAGFVYREAAGLAGLVILRAELELQPATPEVVREKRLNYGSRRLNVGGKHSAGSIFRNPPGDYAGRLLEVAGGKELRVGGARILETHANVVIAEAGATASDVTVLIKQMQNLVRRQHGVELIPEVRLWQNFTTWPF